MGTCQRVIGVHRPTANLRTTFYRVLLALILLGFMPLPTEEAQGRSKEVPIVYVFKISSMACSSYKFPPYILHTLEQAVMTQPDAEVVMASNYAECPDSNLSVLSIPSVTLVDTTLIASKRTLEFINTSAEVFQSDGKHELWITSALRFLNLEDIMRHLNFSEVFHVEADNLLYGKLSFLTPGFRSNYGSSLAVTPLTANKYLMTASLLWIPSLEHIVHFNNFLLGVGRTVRGGDRDFTSSATATATTSNPVLVVENSTIINATASPTRFPTSAPTPDPGSYSQYIDYLRPKACCRWGGPGHLRDENGTLLPGHTGIKPFMVNEMSLLAYYKHLYPTRLLSLPVVPQTSYNLNRWVCNMSEFGPRGKEVGPALLVTDAQFVAQHRRQQLHSENGTVTINKHLQEQQVVEPMDFLFDPNSYGQFLGGTFRQGKRGFTDVKHIVGQAMRTTGCQVNILCGNSSMHLWWNVSTSSVLNLNGTGTGTGKSATKSYTEKPMCYTAPFVYCGTFFPGGWKPPIEEKASAVNESSKSIATNSSSYDGQAFNSSFAGPHNYTNFIQHPPWNAIINLHVHSKNTAQFKSVPCSCDL